jgi:hypothetical protein
MIFHSEKSLCDQYIMTEKKWQETGRKIEETEEKRRGPCSILFGPGREVKGKEANPEDEKIRVTVM